VNFRLHAQDRVVLLEMLETQVRSAPPDRLETTVKPDILGIRVNKEQLVSNIVLMVMFFCTAYEYK